nr:hypothetical protein CPGR_00269 [Mycolicibacterium malmesburyense]
MRPYPRCRQAGIEAPQQLSHTPVSDCHPLRETGGARRVDQVRDIVTTWKGQGHFGFTVDPGIVDIDDDHVAPVQPVGQPCSGNHRYRRSIIHNEAHTARRHRRIERQIGGPGFEHRQHRYDGPGGTRQQQCHTLSRAHILVEEHTRQPVGGLIKLAVCQRHTFARHSHRRRCLGYPGGEQRRNRDCRSCRRGQHLAVADLTQVDVLRHVEKVDRRQPPHRVGGHGLQHPRQPLDQRLDADRIEDIGAILHRTTDTRRLAGLGEALT